MPEKKKMLCSLGQYDIPIVQKQPVFEVDLLDKNIALFGAAMSGKTNFLKMLIQVLHMKFNADEEQIFILDFGNALLSCREMPLVSACFDNSNEEYVKRAFKIIDEIIKGNTKMLNGVGFSDFSGEMKHTTFIIDNLNVFKDEPRYTTYHEKFAKLCRDGISKGVTVVFTASDTKGVLTYLSNSWQKIALEMPFDKYLDIFNTKVSEICTVSGRGFANVTVKPKDIEGTLRMNLPYEVQCFLATDDDEKYLENLKAKFEWDEKKQSYGKSVRKYLAFSDSLTFEEYCKLKQPPKKEAEDAGENPCFVTVGLDYINFYPISVDFSESRVIGIYGSKEYGKTNLLRVILNQLFEKKKNSRFVFVDDGRKQLEEFIELSKKKNLETYAFSNMVKQEMPLDFDQFTNRHKAAESVIKKEKTKEEIINEMADEVIKRSEKRAEMFGNNKSKEIEEAKEIKGKPKKFSPLQQFYGFLGEYYLDLSYGKQLARNDIYSPVAKYVYGENNAKIMNEYKEEKNPSKSTVFVLQNKSLYLSANGEKQFINNILPKLAAVADEEDYIFIFTDVQRMADPESNAFFNNVINTVFLLDDAARFVSERGQKTILGSMDAKNLKEEFAHCEVGDGYYYDADAADSLLKMKFIKLDKDNELSHEQIDSMLEFDRK